MAGKGDVISIIKEKYGTMSKSHKTIANFILFKNFYNTKTNNNVIIENTNFQS